MTRQRKHDSPEQKVAIFRRHLLEKVPVFDLCDELGLNPTVFYSWQKLFFENAAAASANKEAAANIPRTCRAALLSGHDPAKC